MTQITLNIENVSILPHLKKVLESISGVSIAKTEVKHPESGIEEAYEDIKTGRITHCKDVDDMFQQILG